MRKDSGDYDAIQLESKLKDNGLWEGVALVVLGKGQGKAWALLTLGGVGKVCFSPYFGPLVAACAFILWRMGRAQWGWVGEHFWLYSVAALLDLFPALRRVNPVERFFVASLAADALHFAAIRCFGQPRQLFGDIPPFELDFISVEVVFILVAAIALYIYTLILSKYQLIPEEPQSPMTPEQPDLSLAPESRFTDPTPDQPLPPWLLSPRTFLKTLTLTFAAAHVLFLLHYFTLAYPQLILTILTKHLIPSGPYLVATLLLIVFTVWTAGELTSGKERIPWLKTTMIRKVFHVLALAIYVPGLLWYPRVLLSGFALALGVFVGAEILRVAKERLVGGTFGGERVWRWMKTFDDGKDRVFIVTHTYLLIGCIWPAFRERERGWRFGLAPRPLETIIGVILVAVCDTSASIIGKSFGSIRLGRKSLEGTLAFALSGLVANWLIGNGKVGLREAVIFSSMAFVELTSKLVDNLVIPTLAHRLLGVLPGALN